MIKHAKDLQAGDVIEGVGQVERVAIHAADYKAPKRSKAGKQRGPAGMRGVVCPPFKPVPTVEVRIAGREAPEFYWPKQKLTLTTPTATAGRGASTETSPAEVER